MKGIKLLSRIAFSPWFLAIFPTLLLIIFLPRIGEKYTLIVERPAFSPYQLLYADLNSDSITECLSLEQGKPYNHVSIKDNNQRYYDQWNFPDSLVQSISYMFIGNYDHDRYKEIYLFTVHADSLFLNVNEFFDQAGTRMQHIFMTKIGFVDHVYTSTLYNCGFYDENGDGKDELYFSIATGFGLEPRRIYCYDLANKKLKMSEFTGFIFLSPQMEDMDGDNRPEIFGMASASGNYKTKTPYTDYSSWLMVFDDHLRFKFKPLEFPGFTNGLITLAYKNNSDKKFVVIHQTANADTNIMKSRIMIYSFHGELIRYRLLSEFGNEKFINIQVLERNPSDKIILVSERLQVLNEKLEVVKSCQLPFNSYIYSQQADLDGDGNNELLLYCPGEEKLQVYNSDLSILVEKIVHLPAQEWKISYVEDINHMHKVCLSSNGDSSLLSIRKNLNYIFGYLTFPGVYFFFFLFILLLWKISTYQLAQRENLRRRLISLQLQSIKGQLDPHFTFNALNSISALIYEDDRQSAYDHMNKFTQLLRRMLNDAERIYRSLKEEIEFVTTYLDLEKLRFGDKFRYEIILGEGIEQNEQVPKMVLQTFAENAIKHGIMPCAKDGILLIKAEREKDYLKLTVEDNGIGRAKAAGQSTSTGKGLKINDEFYEILNQINKRPIRHTITDLYDESGQAAGTRVDVWIPAEELKE